MKRYFILSVLSFGLLVTGCQQRVVKRVDPDQQIDLSGRWNDVDSKLVAKEMIQDVLNRPWRTSFESKNGRKPVVIIGIVKNKSSEHIDAENFIKDMEKEFINTATVKVVQGGEFREQIRKERADQQEFASPETMKKWKKEMGADFMMTGVISSITDEYGKQKVVYYQINLELSDMETNEKVWLNDKKIKKLINN